MSGIGRLQIERVERVEGGWEWARKCEEGKGMEIALINFRGK